MRRLSKVLAASTAAFIAVALTARAAPAPTDKCLLDWVESELPSEVRPAAGNSAPSASTTSQVCGYGTSFLNTYRHGKNSFAVSAAGQTFRFMPLALYNKLDSSYCDRIKIRNACYEIRSSEGNLSIRLYDKDLPDKGFADFAIMRDGHLVIRSDGRLSQIHREFALIRSEYTTTEGGRSIVIPSRIDDRIVAFRNKAKSCGGGAPKKCLSGLEATAENMALERLRSERFPRLPDPDVRRDLDEMDRFIGSVGQDRKIIHEMMLRNELGKGQSPYALSDASIENSGLSFGVRQLDIAGGDEAAERIFASNLADFETASDWNGLTPHKRFVYGPSFRVPIRKYTVAQLTMLHQAVPALQKAMRTEIARRRYNAHHSSFLTAERRRYAALRKQCLFKDSAYLTLAAIDRRNQNRKFYNTVMSEVAKRCRDGASTRDAEAAVAAMFGRYKYRSDSIEELVRDNNLR
jgi:hypothetical protein